MKALFKLDGKTAVVIGGAGGLGEAIALGLSFYGAKLVVASRMIQNVKLKPLRILFMPLSVAWKTEKASRCIA